VTGPDPRRWKALAVLGVAYLMVVLDVSIVNVALPSIQKDLNFSPENLQWVISAYGLTFGGLLLLGGRAGDILGRRRLFMAGLGFFALFSLLCGLATSSGMLIAFRGAQGAAGAILSPSVFSIVTVAFAEGKERNTALGILGGIAARAASTCSRRLRVRRRWIFFVNVPCWRSSRAPLRPGSRSEGCSFGRFCHREPDGARLRYQASKKDWGDATSCSSRPLMVAFLLRSRVSHPLSVGVFRRRTPTGVNIIGFGRDNDLRDVLPALAHAGVLVSRREDRSRVPHWRSGTQSRSRSGSSCSPRSRPTARTSRISSPASSSSVSGSASRSCRSRSRRSPGSSHRRRGSHRASSTRASRSAARSASRF
jgi:hypothetical protein